jgi:hypothetical protein
MSEIGDSIRDAIRHAEEPVLVQIPRWMLGDLAQLAEVRARRLESEARRSGEGVRRSKHGLAYEWNCLAVSIRAQGEAQK